MAKKQDKFLTGDEVKAWRISRNLTQPELGRWLGITQQAVARYELVGVSKTTALAFSAIDRGLQPVKITRADLRVVRETIRLKANPTRKVTNVVAEG